MTVERDIEHRSSQGFVEALEKVDATIGVSTYSASRLLSIWAESGEVGTSSSRISRAMGIGFEDGLMAVASVNGIGMFKRLAAAGAISESCDWVWVERAKYHTGPIDSHDVAIAERRIFAVNTAWSCVSYFGFEQSFRPAWKPNFISGFAPEDRCHLNGMAVKNGRPAYVTSLGNTDAKKGWKDSIMKGGLLMDVGSNSVLAEGLALPHSPVFDEVDGRLYFLQSGTGELCEFDFQTRSVVPLLGTGRFIRGLAIRDGFAFIGFSKLRTTSKTFAPLQQVLRGDECGVLSVDLHRREVTGELIFTGEVDELYDVSFFPGKGRHMVVAEADPLHAHTLVLKDKMVPMRNASIARWPGA